MIGIDQQPSPDTLAALNAALGEGQYTIEYRETPHGVAILVQTREVPERVWSSQVANGVARPSIDGIWSELTSRITASVKHDRREAQQTAAESRADADRTAADALADSHSLNPPGTEGAAVTLPDGRVVESQRDAERTVPGRPSAMRDGYPPIPDALLESDESDGDGKGEP